MANYTTQIRTICENAANSDERKGYSDINSILTTAAPIVFDFDFPIFDEAYRLPLEKKILKHYYTREISEETVGLWKLRLDTRMNEIMPFYNKLYESELLEFNPFYDVDYTRTGQRIGQDTGVEVTDTENNTVNGMIGTVQDESDNTLIDKMTGTITDETERSLTDSMTGTITDEGENSLTDRLTGTITDARENSLTDEMTGTVADAGTNQIIETMEGTITDESDTTSIRTDNLTSATINGGSDHEEGSNVNKNDHWDYYSDTPQGTVQNLDDLTYLTNARHIVDDGTGSETSKDIDYGKTTNTTNTGTQRNEDDSEVTRTYDTENTKNGIDSNTRTYNTTNTKEGEDTNTRTHNTTDTKTGTDENVRTYDTESTKNGTDETTRTHDTTNTKTGTNDNIRTYDTTNTIDGTGKSTTNKLIDSLQDYSEHVIGKMATTSYAKLLKEFRETFMNIDMMIIRDLSDLFFGLW